MSDCSADRKLTLIMREIYRRREDTRILVDKERCILSRIEAIIFNEELPLAQYGREGKAYGS